MGVVVCTACAAIVGIDDRLPIEVDAGPVPPDVNAPPEGCPSETSCVKVPEGWTLVSFDPQKREACPTGYDNPTDLEVLDTSDCSCTCTETTPAKCVPNNTVTVRSYQDPNCSTGNFTDKYFSVGDGGCRQAAFTPSQPPSSARIIVSPSAAVCGSSVGVSAPMPLQKGRTCASTGPRCPEGVCAMPVGTEQCVVHEGVEPCPPEYPHARRTGHDPTDTRACSSCKCASSLPTNCSEQEVVLFRDNACTDASVPVKACAFFVDGRTYQSYQVNTPPLVGCVPTAPPTLTDGGVTFQKTVTVCCASAKDGG